MSLKEKFKNKFGEPEANNEIVSGSETTDEIADWFISKFRDMIENHKKIGLMPSIFFSIDLQLKPKDIGYNQALSDLLAELEE